MMEIAFRYSGTRLLKQTQRHPSFGNQNFELERYMLLNDDWNLWGHLLHASLPFSNLVENQSRLPNLPLTSLSYSDYAHCSICSCSDLCVPRLCSYVRRCIQLCAVFFACFCLQRSKFVCLRVTANSILTKTCMMSTELLKCTICPKIPVFSDISHLLTHVGSKGHLSHLHKLQIRGHQDLVAAHKLARYNQWFQEHGMAALLSERMHQKEEKKNQKAATEAARLNNANATVCKSKKQRSKPASHASSSSVSILTCTPVRPVR